MGTGMSRWYFRKAERDGGLVGWLRELYAGRPHPIVDRLLLHLEGQGWGGLREDLEHQIMLALGYIPCPECARRERESAVGYTEYVLSRLGYWDECPRCRDGGWVSMEVGNEEQGE